MDIILMFIYAILFSITSAFFLIYFKRLKSINLEYTRLKRAFEDIIFSFNKDLQKIEGQIQEISGRISAEGARDEMRSLFDYLKSKLDELIGFKERVSAEIDKLLAKYNEIENKVGNLKVIGNERKLRFYDDRSEEYLLPKLKENKPLAPLTATELRVLEILASEGEKTVPEIKDRIGLTREHTARLLKSLYERGYVERVSNRIPYVYRLAREMDEIIKKKE
ncbi:MAG: helix-turn-helix domain-containing protein [Candidatus Bathyarchaeia archaeon]